MQRSSQSVILLTIITLAIIMAVGGFLAIVYLQSRLNADPLADSNLPDSTTIMVEDRSITVFWDESYRVEIIAAPPQGDNGGQGIVDPIPTATAVPPLPTNTPAPPPTATRSPESVIFKQYTVQSGDSLSGIVEKHNHTTSISLMAQHGISSIDMVPGKVIERLPYGNPEFCQPHRVYAVAEGDTVYNITRQFNVTVEQIKEINDLNDQHLIYSTQILCIP